MHEAPTDPSNTPEKYKIATLNEPIHPGWPISKGIPKIMKGYTIYILNKKVLNNRMQK